MGEYSEVYCIHRRKARKNHKCCECKGEIVPGEVYREDTGIFDNEPFRTKTCLDCAELRDSFNKDIPYDERPCAEELCEYIFESDNLHYITLFLKIKEKRKANILQWMNDTFDKLANHVDEIESLE